jgi:hypothetical protein
MGYSFCQSGMGVTPEICSGTYALGGWSARLTRRKSASAKRRCWIALNGLPEGLSR